MWILYTCDVRVTSGPNISKVCVYWLLTDVFATNCMPTEKNVCEHFLSLGSPVASDL